MNSHNQLCVSWWCLAQCRCHFLVTHQWYWECHGVGSCHLVIKYSSYSLWREVGMSPNANLATVELSLESINLVSLPVQSTSPVHWSSLVVQSTSSVHQSSPLVQSTSPVHQSSPSVRPFVQSGHLSSTAGVQEQVFQSPLSVAPVDLLHNKIAARFRFTHKLFCMYYQSHLPLAS